jgi:glyoxylase-like metal-dependent hydrolase (beta-lactamase superfamily II)
MKTPTSRVLGAALVLILAGAAVFSQQRIPTGGPIPDVRGFNNKITNPAETSKINVVVRHVAGKVFVIAGAGGNMAVFAGDDGVMLADTNFTVFYDQIMRAIRQISDKSIKYVLNTHSHLDHVQNNENMEKMGALIISTPNLRSAMLRAAGTGQNPRRGIPVITAIAPLTIHFNGEEVVFVPLKPSHTDGDGAVYFRGSDVWVFGDTFTRDTPAIGVANGGTIDNFIENYNLALDMTTPRTTFIPGHGQLSTRSDLIEVRDMITTVHARFRDMVAQGMTIEQIKESRPSKEFDAKWATENISPTTGNTMDRWYRDLYAEITAELAAKKQAR